MGTAIVIALALSGCGWTARQATLAATSTALLAADWKQTRGITAQCLELNPLLGECGERFPVNVYFPLVMVANLGIAHLLGPWREVQLGAVTGAEAATVWSNWRSE